MKPRPSPRPAPRTLAATPPLPTRAPHSTQYQTRFPALAVALASGALVPACESPQCGDSRADELQRHGAQGLQNAGNGRVSEGLREIGVALGLVSHGSTRDIGRTAGAVAPVNVVPPPPQNVTGGVQAPVSPEPPQVAPQADPQQPAPPQHTTTVPTTPLQTRGGGAVRSVTPTQPQPPPRPPHPIRTAGVPRRTTPDPTRPPLDL